MSRSSRSALVGLLLATAYAVLAVAAMARSAVQLGTRLQTAPVPYLLSALSAAVYLGAAVAFRRTGVTARRVAALACGLELAGVLAVGTWSVLDPVHFPDQTVWSTYGQGYGFVPLVLPVLGLGWLRSVRVLETEARTRGDHDGADSRPVRRTRA